MTKQKKKEKRKRNKNQMAKLAIYSYNIFLLEKDSLDNFYVFTLPLYHKKIVTQDQFL